MFNTLCKFDYLLMNQSVSEKKNNRVGPNNRKVLVLFKVFFLTILIY